MVLKKKDRMPSSPVPTAADERSCWKGSARPLPASVADAR
jgi:hypothetical protein